MRKGFAIVLIAAVLFGGGYFYYIAQAVCPAPLSYSLGELDDRFGITRSEAQLAVAEAESVWEDATGRNLFSFVEKDGSLLINFVYDDRQEFVEAEGELKDKLDATEDVSEAIRETYTKLVTQYNELRLAYADKAESYERKLNAYNQKVEKYNEEGGAPADAYEALSEQKEELGREQQEINALASTLNKLVAEINRIGEQGNRIIDTYNEKVDDYNERFGESREFTQGDYSNGTIHIYSFEDKAELQAVLVHELGHALSLGHVDKEQSAMYYLIGDQPATLTLTQQDRAEFNRVCGENSIFKRIMISLGM